MGTRNLTMVISNGKTKVAQYGQWDGYPSGQGATILKTLKRIDASGQWQSFKDKINALNWLTKGQESKIEKDGDFTITHPYLSRDCGGKIIEAIHFGEMEVSTDTLGKEAKIPVKIIGVQDNSNFAGDSLFCQWAYVIDLDKNTFEVYKGFNQTPLTESDRFYHLQSGMKGKQDKYYPVKMVKSYDLDNLPKETDFIKELDN